MIVDIENLSVKRLANPKVNIIGIYNFEPTAPTTTAKVVIFSSIAP